MICLQISIFLNVHNLIIVKVFDLVFEHDDFVINLFLKLSCIQVFRLTHTMTQRNFLSNGVIAKIGFQ